MIGQKQYEITDHLGNVLSTVSDQHLGRDINGDSVIDYYNAVIPTAYDYYPFGMLMPFRYTQDNSTHCATITTDKLYPVWVHHNIILNNGTTPIANSYGSGVATVLTRGTGINIYSPMITSGATISVPLQQKLAYNMDLNIQSICGSYSAQVLDSDSTVLGAITIAESGNFSLYYSAPSASPVTLVFKAQSAGSNISVLAAGYWVFTHQSKMVTMTICDQNDNYRFGFNGKLKDNEWAGLGNSLNYGFRMEDTRIARFRSVDPLTKKFPMLTTYQFASNTPVWAIDLDGKEARVYNDISFPIGHTFISVIDNDGIINVYTYGQYGEGKDNNKQGPIGIGVLVHLKGDAANAYIRSEFKNNPNKLKVYEVSDKVIKKEKIIEHYSQIMKHNNTVATSNLEPIKLARQNAATGSEAIIFGHYDGLAGGSIVSQNCTSTVLDAMHDASNSVIPYTSCAIPQILNSQLKIVSSFSSDYVEVTNDAKNKAELNLNGTPIKVAKPETNCIPPILTK